VLKRRTKAAEKAEEELRSQTPDIFLEKNNVEIDRPRLQVLMKLVP